MGIESQRVAAILLAAGRSERFGAAKLVQLLHGIPLAEHAARTLASIAFAQRFVVVGRTGFDLPGFEPVLTDPDGPLSASIAAGVAAASGADACLIALADMPLVPAQHFRALLAAHDGSINASRSNGRTTVPALFDRSLFDQLTSLQGDSGARALLADAACVDIDPRWMVDIDVPQDLRALDRLCGQRKVRD